ncbi:MAG: hypothetical protein LBO79_02835 [Zoogloeaceae bacterium]|nr:hypothetical protein [Zoogloeaceae bacterium]
MIWFTGCCRLPGFQDGFPRRATAAAKGKSPGGQGEVVLFPRYFGEFLLCGFVLLGEGEVTFFGSLLTNIVTSRVVGVGMGEWTRKDNQGVKGFECFWHMSCL